MIFTQKCYGVSTSRESTIINKTSSILEFPINNSIVRYDSNKMTQMFAQQLHDSVITSLISVSIPDKILISTCYSGEISVWKDNSSQQNQNTKYELISKPVKTKTSKLTSSSFDPNKNLLMTICEPIGIQTNEINIFSIEIDEKGQCLIKLIFSFFENILCGWFLDSENMDIILYDEKDNCLKHFLIKDNLKHEIDKSKLFSEKVYDFSILRDEGKYICLLCEKGFLCIIAKNDIHSIQLLQNPFFDKKTSVKTVLFINNSFMLIASDDGCLAVWKKNDKEIFEHKKNLEILKNHVFNISFVENILFVASVSSLHKYKLDLEELEIRLENGHESHQLTCSGIAVCPRSFLVASVDFAGNLFIWDQKSDKNEVVFSENFECSLRSVDISRSKLGDVCVLIGDLEGNLIYIQINVKKGVFVKKSQKIVAKLKGGIMAIRRHSKMEEENARKIENVCQKEICLKQNFEKKEIFNQTGVLSDKILDNVGFCDELENEQIIQADFSIKKTTNENILKVNFNNNDFSNDVLKNIEKTTLNIESDFSQNNQIEQKINKNDEKNENELIICKNQTKSENEEKFIETKNEKISSKQHIQNEDIEKEQTNNNSIDFLSKDNKKIEELFLENTKIEKDEKIENKNIIENDEILDQKIIVVTGKGYYSIFNQIAHTEFITELCVFAHRPMVDYYDSRFGSLGYFCEIWSVTFSPDASHFCTSSEDQTAAIWNCLGDKVHTFVGHSSPVTSVSWTFNKNLETEVIGTCGDDQRVIVWALNEKNQAFKRKWVLHYSFETNKFGMDWHTLTYISICQTKTSCFIVVGGQIGNLFICDLDKKEIVFKEKIHYGSIEGLMTLPYSNDMSKSMSIVTCGSDCTVSCIDIS